MVTSCPAIVRSAEMLQIESVRADEPPRTIHREFEWRRRNKLSRSESVKEWKRIGGLA
jgi:hypothetical protein